MAISKIRQVSFLALIIFLPGVAFLPGIATEAVHAASSPRRLLSSTELAQRENRCRQTTSQLDIYEQPDSGSQVVGNIGRGDRITMVPRSTRDRWTRISAPQNGYVLTRYLQACNRDGNLPSSSGDGGQGGIVQGCGQVLDLGLDSATGTPNRLRLHSYLDGQYENAYDAIAPRGIVALGASEWRDGRHWVSVLAYQSVDPPPSAPSRSGQAWAAESGPNAPRDLDRTSIGTLIYVNGSLYPDLNIVRRRCSALFRGLITEGQPVPTSLPDGFHRP